MNPDTERLLQSAREVTLVTTGRKNGSPREAELWFAYDAGAVYFLAGVNSSGTPTNWCRNLQANPKAALQMEGKSISVVNEPVADAEALKGRVWDLFQAKYGRSTMRQWYQDGRHVPVKLRVVA